MSSTPVRTRADTIPHVHRHVQAAASVTTPKVKSSGKGVVPAPPEVEQSQVGPITFAVAPSGGFVSGTAVDVTGSFNQDILNDNFNQLIIPYNLLIAEVANLRAVVEDLRSRVL